VGGTDQGATDEHILNYPEQNIPARPSSQYSLWLDNCPGSSGRTSARGRHTVGGSAIDAINCCRADTAGRYADADG
jgi:hypothetical protein